MNVIGQQAANVLGDGARWLVQGPARHLNAVERVHHQIFDAFASATKNQAEQFAESAAKEAGDTWISRGLKKHYDSLAKFHDGAADWTHKGGQVIGKAAKDINLVGTGAAAVGVVGHVVDPHLFTHGQQLADAGLNSLIRINQDHLSSHGADVIKGIKGYVDAPHLQIPLFESAVNIGRDAASSAQSALGNASEWLTSHNLAPVAKATDWLQSGAGVVKDAHTSLTEHALTDTIPKTAEMIRDIPNHLPGHEMVGSAWDTTRTKAGEYAAAAKAKIDTIHWPGQGPIETPQNIPVPDQLTQPVIDTLKSGFPIDKVPLPSEGFYKDAPSALNKLLPSYLPADYSDLGEKANVVAKLDLQALKDHLVGKFSLDAVPGSEFVATPHTIFQNAGDDMWKAIDPNSELAKNVTSSPIYEAVQGKLGVMKDALAGHFPHASLITPDQIQHLPGKP